jgi:ubiquitin carboxyl-terminal hydrolase 10
LTNGSTKGNAPLTASNLNANNRLSQEDAHEFLGFFLDTIHEELLIKIEQHDTMIWQKATKGVKAGQDALARQSVNSIADVTPQSKSNTSSAVNGASGGQEDEDWLEVGQKGKTATTRTTEQQESAVTRIFGGQLRSVLRCPGQKDSVTLEPYTSLQLEIHVGLTSLYTNTRIY